MATGPPVCLSIDSIITKSTQKTPRATSVHDPCDAMVAPETLALSALTIVLPASAPAPILPGHVASGPQLASTSRTSALDCLAIERGHLLDMGLSGEVVDTLLVSRRNSTVRIYNSTWKVSTSGVQENP